MRKTKEQNGITLVALIITVIVLLILAVVTIAAVTDGGIMNHARNATGRYNSASQTETSILGYYEQYLQKDGEVLKCEVDYSNGRMRVLYMGEGNKNETYTIENYGWSSQYDEWYLEEYNVPYYWEIGVELGQTYNIRIIRDSDGTVVAQKQVKAETYDSIFQFSFNTNTKKATITGIKFENIEITKKTESAVVLVEEFSIIDNSGNRISTLEIPSIIKLGDEEYEVEKIEELVNSSYSGGYYLGEAKNTDITGLIIPSSIKEISNMKQTFKYFTNLEDVNIEADIDIETGTFAGTPWLESVYADNGNLFIHKGKIICANSGASKIVIPSEVTSLPGGIFSNCSALTEVEGITPGRFTNEEVVYAFITGMTGDGSFCNSQWFKEQVSEDENFITYNDVLIQIKKAVDNQVNIPDEIKTIAAYTIRGTASLGDVTVNIPSSVTSIDNYAFFTYAFQNSNVTTINIAKTQNSIEGAPWCAHSATINWTGNTQ